MAVRSFTFIIVSVITAIYSNSLLADHKACEPDAPGTGQTTPPKNVVVQDIEIINNPIFESDEQSIWIHHLANTLHIMTQPKIIENRLSFDRGDTIDLGDIEESERLLRRLDYLRDAKVELSTDCNHHPDGNIIVNTWDHWTLYPKINFSRSGGENKYSYGIKDDNLLGLGIQSDFKYFEDKDRSGYGVKIKSPLTYIKHSTLSLAAFNNDDGYHYGLGLDKPFYTFDTTQGYYFNSDHSKQNLHIDQNGEDDGNVFLNKNKFFETAIGWSEGKKNNWTQRISIGITSNEQTFAPTDDPDEVTLALPDDRRFIYPWVQFQLIEDDFEVISDVHFIYEKEDLQLGWRHSLRLGIEADDEETDDDLAGHFRSSTSAGFLSGNHLFLGSFSTVVDFGVAEKDYLKAVTGFEYFYNWNPDNKLYIKTELTATDNNYIDQPLTLGGSIDNNDNDLEFSSATQTTVRGYPSQYQHGNHRWQSTVEIRHYPNIELYRLARVAWVGFIDAGRTWGDHNLTSDNEEDSTLASFGVGVRLASIRSSGRNVIHFDIAKTLTSGDNVDSWEIRAHAEQRF